ncbi:MAG: ferritin family protein [bacterium]
MTDAKQEMADILKVGIKTEIEGQNFYSRMAQKISHPETKKRVQQMAADEVVHERRLRELYDKVIGGDPADLPKTGLDIYQQAFGERDLTEADKFKFIDLAMEAELDAARRYKKGEQATDDPAVAKVFAELVAEEDGHYNMLIAEKEALRGNIDWFSFGEQAMMEE